MLDLFLSASKLGCAEFSYSLHMMIVMEGARKEKKGLEFLFFSKNPVDLLKLLVATAYACVEYTTFARKATYCVRIVQLLRVSDLLRTYTTCALEATCAYDVRLCA